MGPLLLVVLTLLSPVSGRALAQQPVVIEYTTLVSPHLGRPLTNVSILLANGRVQAIGRADELSIPPGSRRIDGAGKWVIPGLIEFHTHTTAPDALRRALALGITVAQVIGRPRSPQEREDESHAAETATPRLVFLTGFVGEFMERMGAEGVSKPRTVEEAERDVIRMHAEGVRAVKIWQDDGSLWFPADQTFPSISPDVFEALVRTAHARGMTVAAHAWRLRYFTDAIDAGVDRLVHPVADSIVPSPVWSRMRQKELAWSTTMTVLLTFGDRSQYARRVLSDPKLVATLPATSRARLMNDAAATEFPSYSSMPTLRAKREAYMQTVQQNTRNARAEGVSIVVASDATVGVGTHIEMELMAESGLTPHEVLTAATLDGARALGMVDRIGTIETGKTADLVILNANPLEDVRNLRDIHLVLKGGHVFQPDALVGGGN